MAYSGLPSKLQQRNEKAGRVKGRQPAKRRRPGSVDHSDLELEGAGFIAGFLAADERQRSEMRAEGAALAARLHRQAVDLAYAKATEFSPRIRLYHLLAAKVALLAHWPNADALALYERDIFYYRNFESTRPWVDEYERFRQAFIRAEGG